MAKKKNVWRVWFEKSNQSTSLAVKLIRKHRVRFIVKQENIMIYYIACILNIIGK